MPGPLIRELTNCPDLLGLHASNPARYPFLLDSSATHPQRGRYHILFAFPGHSLVLQANGELLDSQGEPVQGTFLDALDREWQTAIMADEAVDLPFHGGWFVYLGYELAGQLEPTLSLPATGLEFPGAFAVRIPAAVIVDVIDSRAWLLAEHGHDDKLQVMAGDIDRAPPMQAPGNVLPGIDEDPAGDYLDQVRRIKRYIHDGDVFQVNVSRQWAGRLESEEQWLDVYRRLRSANPSPFAGLVRHEGLSICCSSPERLVRVDGRRVDTRPIAGTRPRRAGAREDAASSDTLMTHPKERAEHIMLIDLERNDLGRVCEPGSVEVDELMVLESYAHVHHIVSNVTGRLNAGTTPGEVLRAVFPGGTITGCPKVRCMEIIAELEGVGRGPYTGSMGYLNRDGSMDLNILIRTISGIGREFVIRAGAGIVADSDPDAELEETRAKARGMLLAVTQ